MKKLKEIVDKGDPIFVLDFWIQGDTICKVPTRASLLWDSIENNQNALYKGELPDIRERSKGWLTFRWWLLPLIFLTICWMQLFGPS